MRASLLAWLAASALSAAAADGASIAFLVAERPGEVQHGDSYVLVLEDEAAQEHARALILDPLAAGARIVSARIAAGADGLNRDLRALGEPPWSWHVTEFVEFSDFTIELCDGWPGFVESDVEGWIANTSGQICFWQYTVVEELPEPAGALGLAAGGAALAAARRLGRGRRPVDTISACDARQSSRSA
jgi:hypothetical protein